MRVPSLEDFQALETEVERLGKLLEFMIENHINPEYEWIIYTKRYNNEVLPIARFSSEERANHYLTWARLRGRKGWRKKSLLGSYYDWNTPGTRKVYANYYEDCPLDPPTN